MALKFVHTADWHLGMRFPSFRDEDRPRLTRERLSVVERILGVAERCGADAVLCAGDLFDEPNPEPSWWRGLTELLRKRDPWPRPVFLLPGNHDPLTEHSVWTHDEFRRALPDWVHVVDRDDFAYRLAEGAVLHAAPCRSQAGQRDLALALPARAAGDQDIRIGMVHGSTFDLPDCQTNFPIAADAAERRGFDYLAIGDTHGFREVPPGARVKTVYPGAPEPTGFGEKEAGYVAVVFVTRDRRVLLRRERVAYWTWEERTVRDIGELRAMRDGEDLARHVLRLTVDMRVPAALYDEVERILTELGGTEATHGRVGILQLDRSRLQLDSGGLEQQLDDLPDVLREAVGRLRARQSDGEPEVAERALMHLYRLVRGERG